MGRISILAAVATTLLLLAASASAEIAHRTPKQHLKKRLPSLNSFLSIPAPFIPIFDSEQKQYLDAHNEIRRSMDLPPLVWDPALTAAARAWAVARSGDCQVRRHSDSPYGENILVMDYQEMGPRDVVQQWFSENRFYDGKKMKCRCDPEGPGCECGHFLNVVWRTTVRLGCSGAVYCDDQMGTYVVCEYDPPGLIEGINPFTGFPLR